MPRRKMKKRFKVSEEWILTRKGRVQLYEQNGHRGMFVALDHAGARRLAAFLKTKDGLTRTPAKIGSVAGETLQQQLDYSVEKSGCTCAFLLRGFTANGLPIFDMLEPPRKAK